MNWISVEDELPEAGERVIFAAGEFVGEGWLSLRKQWIRFGSFYPIEVILCEPVTHWMRMPEPPA